MKHVIFEKNFVRLYQKHESTYSKLSKENTESEECTESTESK